MILLYIIGGLLVVAGLWLLIWWLIGFDGED